MSRSLAKAEEVSSTRILTLDSDRVNINNNKSWFFDESKVNIENKIGILLGHNYKHITFVDKL